MEPLVSPFSAFKLSEDELRIARTLSPEQEAYYQTLLADAASEKIAIMPDKEKIHIFLQHEAYLRGQMDMLNMLLGSGDVNRPKRYPEQEPNPATPQT